MREAEFQQYLERDPQISSKEKAVRTRMTKARRVEELLGRPMDQIVAEDDAMYRALLKVRSGLDSGGGRYSNALRKYYQFVRGKEFPRLRDYERR